MSIGDQESIWNELQTGHVNGKLIKNDERHTIITTTGLLPLSLGNNSKIDVIETSVKAN
mgnify:CR=1 FL=1